MLKKEGRGAIDEKTVIVDGVHLSAVRWYDNKAVTLLSTFVGSEPVTEVNRWNNMSKCRETVKCPNVIKVYNKHMGGVYLIDSLIGLYRTRIRSKKWYHRLFFHLLDMTIINAWLLYRRQENGSQSKLMALHEFKTRIAITLCAGKEIKRGRSSGISAGGNTAQSKRKLPEDDMDGNSRKKRPAVAVPLPELPHDGIQHCPKWTSQRQHCKMESCSGMSRVACTKCGVYLCFFCKTRLLPTIPCS